MDESAPGPDRAVLFIDGNNWYHFVSGCGVQSPMDLSYAKISQKLIGPRRWLGTRYYIGALKQDWKPSDYANQRRFLARIKHDAPEISNHLGRLERRWQENPLHDEIMGLLADAKIDMSADARARLLAMARTHRNVETLKEKAVDIMIALDIVEMGRSDQYDAAYLLSADGDFTPVVEAVRKMGKKVYCASPGFSSELQKVANTFIKLPKDWFDDCYR